MTFRAAAAFLIHPILVALPSRIMSIEEEVDGRRLPPLVGNWDTLLPIALPFRRWK